MFLKHAYFNELLCIYSEKIFQIGNAAGSGAQLCLKDSDMRQFANRIAHEVK